MATGFVVPLEEYLSSIYHPDCEWLDGKLVERNRGEPDHAGLEALISWKFLMMTTEAPALQLSLDQIFAGLADDVGLD